MQEFVEPLNTKAFMFSALYYASTSTWCALFVVSLFKFCSVNSTNITLKS